MGERPQALRDRPRVGPVARWYLHTYQTGAAARQGAGVPVAVAEWVAVLGLESAPHPPRQAVRLLQALDSAYLRWWADERNQ